MDIRALADRIKNPKEWTKEDSYRQAISSGLILFDLAQSHELNKTRNAALKNIGSGFTDTKDIVQKIANTLDKNAPHQIKQGNVIAIGIDKNLDELRDLAHGGKKWIKEYQETERKKTGVSSLKIGFNRVFGYYIEVTKTHQERVPESYIRRQTLVGSERYITPELKEYEEKILSAESEIEEIEQRIFDTLCDKLR